MEAIELVFPVWLLDRDSNGLPIALRVDQGEALAVFRTEAAYRKFMTEVITETVVYPRSVNQSQLLFIAQNGGFGFVSIDPLLGTPAHFDPIHKLITYLGGSL